MWGRTALCLLKTVLYIIFMFAAPMIGFLFEFIEKVLDKMGA